MSSEPTPAGIEQPPGILVPLRIIDGESVPEGLVSLLSGSRVVLLGYHKLPEQTSPSQARLQYEESATKALQDTASLFRDADIEVDPHLVFTHKVDQTIDRIADETDCTAIVLPRPAVGMDNLLIAVRGIVNARRIAAIAGPIAAASDISVTILFVRGEQTTDAHVTEVLNEAETTLQDLGVAAELITTQIETSDRPIRKIADVAVDFDAVVMGESESTLLGRLFGQSSERIADRFLGPVVVVTNPNL